MHEATASRQGWKPTYGASVRVLGQNGLLRQSLNATFLPAEARRLDMAEIGWRAFRRQRLDQRLPDRETV
jgi:hypothetical protein